MIVVARPAGQLANRLFQFAHFVALAADTGVTVANPAFGRFANYFPAFSRDALCRYPDARGSVPTALRPVVARAAAVALRGARALPGIAALDVPDDEGADLESPELRALWGKRRLVFVAGWQLRASGAFARQRKELRRVFSPAEAHVSAAGAAVAQARTASPVVVGVHRRRGDYRAWRDGRYLFDDNQYAAVMRRMRELLGGDVAFLLCSDEPLPARAFAGLSVYPGPGRPIEDLHALSLCDRLIGPPSTFGSWASFMGEVPRYQIHDPRTEFALDDLRVWDWG
jgi:hypothetical protein